MATSDKSRTLARWIPNVFIGLLTLFTLYMFFGPLMTVAKSDNSGAVSTTPVIVVSPTDYPSVPLSQFKDAVSRVKSISGEEVIVAFEDKKFGFVSLITESRKVYFLVEAKGRQSIIDGDVYDVENGMQLSDAHGLMFSPVRTKSVSVDVSSAKKNNTGLVTQKKTAPEAVRPNEAAFDEEAYKKAMLARIGQIESLPDVVKPSVNSAASAYGNPMGGAVPAPNNCFIEWGGFKQPMVGYDMECNSLTPEQKQEQAKKIVTGLPEEFYVSFKAKEEKHQIFVFTDYTCGYCQSFHRLIDRFNDKGVTVNYLFYPRAIAEGSDAQAKVVVSNMNSAWCSDDQVKATHDLWSKGFVPPSECKKDGTKLDSPVREHYILGLLFNIRGTPMIVADNGKIEYGNSFYKLMNNLDLK